jgi:hypothetical protein
LISVTASGKIGKSSWGIGFSRKIGVAPEKLDYLPSAVSSQYLPRTSAEILYSA